MNPTFQNINNQTQDILNNLSNNNTLFPELVGKEVLEMMQLTNCLDYYLPNCTDNKYDVYYHGKDDEKKTLYEIREEDTEICQQFFCYKCHKFNLKVHGVASDENDNPVTLEARKQFDCGIYDCIWGCGNAELPVEVRSKQKGIFGKIILNYDSCCCACCSSRLEIMDEKGQVIYTVKGNCPIYPVGCFCNHCIIRCCNCPYNIYQGGPGQGLGPEVGMIEKKCCSSCRECCTKACDYKITFPHDAIPEDKMLIIMATTLLDSQSFFL